MSRGQNVPLVHCARCAELAIAYGEDAGAEEGRDVEVQRGERKESIEQRGEVLREVCVPTPADRLDCYTDAFHTVEWHSCAILLYLRYIEEEFSATGQSCACYTYALCFRW